MTETKRNFGLDLVRALAISLVIVAHFAKTQEYFSLFGVELFFGLSGFLIGQILWRNFLNAHHWSFKQILNFWSRRWWRTLPNYYLFLVVSLFYAYFTTHSLPSLRELSYFLWFGQNLVNRNHAFYGVSWSLCIEEWFYLAFPLVLFIIGKSNLSKKNAYLLTLVCFFICFPISRFILAQHGQADALRTITFARLDAIAYGVLLAFVQVNITLSIRNKIFLFLAGVLFIFMPVIITCLSSKSLETLREDQLLLIMVPLGASLILPLVSLLKHPTGPFAFISTIVEKISLWSYSIYLCHLPILFFMYYLLQDIRTNTMGNLISKVAGLIVTLFISALVYKYFEVPFTKRRPKEIKEYN